MTMKRMIALTICAVMLLAMIPAGILTAGADGTEGDWTVWRDPEKYEDAGWEDVFKPDPGYHYTEDGFATIPPDWTNFTPYFTVQTKEAQPLKKGIYLQFRVDDYPYGGEDGNADHWISFHLSDREGVKPGNIDYGNNWLCLLRGEGDRTQLQSFVTTQSKSTIGSFQHTGSSNIRVPMDDSGRGIYTFQVLWTGSAYELSVNGTVVQDSGNMISKKLLEWVESGEYYVGVTMHAGIRDASASLTILKYGTCREDAVTPVGSDYKEPEENGYLVADIADPAAVPEGQPAILWIPEIFDLRDGWNVSFAPQGDNTWHATVSDQVAYWSFKPKNHWSYAAEDFPVFGMLFRNIWVDGGDLWYSAGDVIAPSTDCSRFSYYDGQVYTDQEGQEYVFIPVDLTGLWEGRINNIRLDFCFEDESCREFDICFAGMFRSLKEAYDYTEEYLVELGVLTESVSETDPVVDPDPDPDDSKPDDSKPDDSKPDDSKPDDSKPGGSENKVPESENAESETLDDLEFIMTTLGCTGSVGGGAVLVLLIGAVLLKKKED